MADSMSEYLKQDMECEGLLECIHGLKNLDKEIFLLLTDRTEPMTVDEIAEAVDRERSTAYRSVQRLVTSGFVQKEQINYDQGGYYHVFRPTDPDEIADDMQRMLNDWYAKMGQLIGEFREKYDLPEEQAVPAES
ncbi:helix-turn-helix domain-containing protein [Halorubrum sp. JWXQ-INN 858]|uniref:helix-turn-helix domain-containing protein n=1 Tax=Halorubrum sp. JWXQ-INN 858 TaxID=2690782 RepID=UPI00135B8BCE|nr:helix-turn-helix domain-containing protein [Halorubrum sp. JWXQ-INN 858]MWV64460.1 helix-turn-helix domain-containing protein [Halorubrum sp. JWXQ-INN 858]